jgi:uncharacterized membrane protein
MESSSQPTAAGASSPNASAAPPTQVVPATGTGLAPNVAGALSYALGLVTGVVFLMVEKDPFVRFHAWQSIVVSVAWIAVWIGLSIASAILGLIPVLGILVVILGLLLSIGLSLGGLILWIVLMLKAFQGERWKLPYLGDYAERYAAQYGA